MEYQDIINSLKINYKKNIGVVVLIVEGANYEFSLFIKIFQDIFHYEIIAKNRNKKVFREYNEFVSKNNDSKIIILNTKNSNIGSIEDEDYQNKLYSLVYEKYELDLKNKPVYYIWDRDNKSNDKDIVERLLLKLTSAYDDGLLLLSYPCVEAYTIANFEKNKYKLNTKIKDYVKEKSFLIDDINKNKIRRAVLEMLKNLAILNIHNFNIDNIAKINLKAFEKEEDYYDNNQSYILLSFISVIFLDLGLIAFRE